MDFEKICMMFTMQEPYYGILLSAMDRVPMKEIGTLGVGRSGNVFKLYYNPDFTENLNIETVLQLLKHEILHLAFNHFTIWNDEDRFDSPDMHKIRNCALDLEINGYLDRSRVEKKAGGVWCEDFGWEKYAGAREYFQRLLKMNQQQQAQAKQPMQPCNGGLGGEQTEETQEETSQNSLQNSSQTASTGTKTSNQSTPNQDNTTAQASSGNQNQTQNVSQELLEKLTSFDSHEEWPDEFDDTTKAELEQIVDDLLVFAEEECNKGRGTIPAEMVGRLTGIKKKKPKPVADWKRYFRRYLGNEFSEFIRKSKKRESRRFPDAAGNRHRRKSHILVAIDTSGSVSMPEYREFFGQIKTLTATADFRVVECDAQIQYEYDFKGRPNETLHGGGGTDFQPVVDLYNRDKKKYDALVYFTDGYCTIPQDTPKDTLWVISSHGDQTDRKRYKVNGASVAFIPKQQ